MANHEHDTLSSAWLLHARWSAALDPAAVAGSERWLVAMLAGLGLPAGLLERVCQSVRQAIAQALEQRAATAQVSEARVHLCIYVPPLRPAEESNWGYFCLARSYGDRDGQDEQMINLYLYTEG